MTQLPVMDLMPWDSEVLLFRAADRQALIERAAELDQYFASHPTETLANVAYSLYNDAQPTACCLAIVADSLEAARLCLATALKRLADPKCRRIKDPAGVYFFQEPFGLESKTAFLFPGEGAQYTNMLLDLCLHFPEVRAWFDLMDRAFVNHPRGYLPSQFVFPTVAPNPSTLNMPDNNSRLWQMDGAVEVTFAANQALLALLNLLEIRADMLVGHSSGEYSALLASGVMRVDNDDRLIEHILDLNTVYERFAQSGQIPEAVLLAVSAPEPDAVARVVATSNDPLFIAMDNCPHQIILCGSQEATNAAALRLQADGAVCAPLPFQRAYHTELFGTMSAPLEEFFGRLDIRPARIPLYSCATAALFPDDPNSIRSLCVRQWSSRVRFRETVETMYANGARVYVEVGPRGNLTAFVDDILRGKPYLAVAANIPGRSGITQLNHLVAMLAAQAVPMNLEPLYAHRALQRLDFGSQTAQQASGGDETGVIRLAMRLPRLELHKNGGNGSNGHPVESGQTQEQRTPQVIQPPHASAETNSKPLPVLDPSSILQPSSPAASGQAAATLSSAALPAGAEQVMQAYFKVMDDFLKLQTKVMQDFLSAVSSGGGNVGNQLPLHGEMQHPAAENETAVQLSAKPGVNSGPPEAVMLTLAEKQPKSEALAAPLSAREDFSKALLTLAAERTGYPLEMLGLDANLESDLGFDSLKRTEILGEFQRRTNLFPRSQLEALLKLKTFHKIIDFIADGVEREASSNIPPVEFRPKGSMADPKVAGLAGPFMREILSLDPGREAHVRCVLDLQEDRFLWDHTLAHPISSIDGNLIGIPVVPLTVSMEILAEAAALLGPEKRVVGMKNLRAYRWITLDDQRISLEITVKVGSEPGEILAQMREEDSMDQALPIIEAVLILAEDYLQFGESATAGVLTDERPSKWPAGQMYASTGMFHGPLFQVVEEMQVTSPVGARALMRMPPVEGFFRSKPNPRFLIDPVLLDAMGQVVGYWTGDQFKTGLSVFPFKLERLNLYGPGMLPNQEALCCLKVNDVDDEWIRSDIVVLDKNGVPLVEMIGWEDRRLDMPRSFYDFRISPAEAYLSALLEPAATAFGTESTVSICREDFFPDEIFEAHGAIWGRVLAYMLLNPSERQVWRGLAQTSRKRRKEWLCGRIAAKDAVRRYLRKSAELVLCPADIEIIPGPSGQPRPAGSWAANLAAIPVLSISHSAGMAVAVAGPGNAGRGLGIDLERSNRVDAKIETTIYTQQERRMLDLFEGAERVEWATRIWCAKEALAKAAGSGITISPNCFEVSELDPQTGHIVIIPGDGWNLQHPGANLDASIVKTIHWEEWIVALAETGLDLASTTEKQAEISGMTRQKMGGGETNI